MLMNHKNFHFTQIANKTNDVIFLKSPKTLFWVSLYNFWSFLLNRDFFQKNQAVIHNCIWAPNTMLSSEKTNEPIPRKLTDRQKDGRKDRQKDPIL